MSRVRISGESSDFFNTIEGMLYSSRFRTDIALYGKRVSEEYLTRCAEYFEQLPDEVMEKLLDSTADHLNDLIQEHAEIVSGLEARDQALVVDAMNRHVSHQAMAMKAVIQKQDNDE